MDLKYIMQKSRYKFIYDSKAILYDTTKLPLYKKELSLFIKELYIYNISLKSLSKECPRPIIKDELLNIAIICTETPEIKKSIKFKRALPYKELSSLSGKPQKFFERWENYILAFFIIYNNNYTSISSLLNIQSNEGISQDKKETQETSRLKADTNSFQDDTITGLVLKTSHKGCYIISAQGAIALVTSKSDVSIGELYSGKVKKERDYYKTPAKLFIFTLVIALITALAVYNHKDRTIIISGSLSIKIEANKWDRVIAINALSSTGHEVKKATKTFNKSLDSALASLLETAYKGGFIKEDSPSTVYISGTEAAFPNITQTKKLIVDTKLPIIINYNGVDLSD